MGYYEDRERERQEEDERRRNYEGDVLYDVWRGRGSVDAIDYDRVGESYRRGLPADTCASQELRRQRRRQEPEPEQEQEPDYEEEY